MEKEFVNGLMVKPPHEKAPDFVKGKISIKREELIQWLQGKNDEWINLDLKESKNGKWYAEVNNWKPESKPLNTGYTQNAQQTPQNAPGWPPQEFVPPPTPERQPPPMDNGFNLDDIPF